MAERRAAPDVPKQSEKTLKKLCRPVHRLSPIPEYLSTPILRLSPIEGNSIPPETWKELSRAVVLPPLTPARVSRC